MSVIGQLDQLQRLDLEREEKIAHLAEVETSLGETEDLKQARQLAAEMDDKLDQLRKQVRELELRSKNRAMPIRSSCSNRKPHQPVIARSRRRIMMVLRSPRFANQRRTKALINDSAMYWGVPLRIPSRPLKGSCTTNPCGPISNCRMWVSWALPRIFNTMIAR